ncbi:MAG: LacI family DNA-binding transcriptional regulator, partial [Clostridiales bacterium]|jgi:LacI family transcriptional regulator|nr:LacI family DNA-binding transcriptional regulator [Clostridiales bacterium]
MPITAKELAKKLNLSAAAVSMALNNKPGVSYQTRKEVNAAAKRYGYDFARLSERRFGAGVSVCFILYKRQGAIVADTPFFSQLSEGIEAGCKNARIKLQISYMHKCDDVGRQLEDIVYSGCSGIILLGTEMLPEDLVPFNGLVVPMVLLDAYFDTLACDCVLINNVQGSFLATDYLISKTKKQPGYLHSTYTIGNFEERADGFYKALRHHGMSTSKSIVHKLTPSVDGAYADMLALLEGGEETAPCYFADNDWIAIGAMKAFAAKGRRIPGDVSLVGFDDVPAAGFVEPALTTVNVPKRYMGEAAARRLIEIMGDRRQSPVKTEVMTSLALRGSV